LAADWARHTGRHIDKVTADQLAEFCVGHSLELCLPEDYYPSAHKGFPFQGPRLVRVYDSCRASPRAPLQVAVFLLDCPLTDDPNNMPFETGMLDVRAAANLPLTVNWSLIRALKFSFPGLEYLKDLLPDAGSSVVYKNSLVPIHRVVADRLSGGVDPTREFLVQFTEQDYENSAWVKEKFVPRIFVDEFWQRVDEDPPLVI
jgi:hypothetical protein